MALGTRPLGSWLGTFQTATQPDFSRGGLDRPTECRSDLGISHSTPAFVDIEQVLLGLSPIASPTIKDMQTELQSLLPDPSTARQETRRVLQGQSPTTDTVFEDSEQILRSLSPMERFLVEDCWDERVSEPSGALGKEWRV